MLSSAILVIRLFSEVSGLVTLGRGAFPRMFLMLGRGAQPRIVWMASRGTGFPDTVGMLGARCAPAWLATEGPDVSEATSGHGVIAPGCPWQTTSSG